MSFTQIELLEAEIKILDDVFKKNSLSLCNGIGKPCEQEIFANPSSLNPNRTSTRLINKYSCDNCIQSKRAIILDTARKRNPLVARLNVLKKAQKIRDEENKIEIAPKIIPDIIPEIIPVVATSSLLPLGIIGLFLYSRTARK